VKKQAEERRTRNAFHAKEMYLEAKSKVKEEKESD
jgi:hypothetical protein